MSIAGLASTALVSVFDGLQGVTQGGQSNSQQFQTELGQDLQSGNLAQA
jgi:hypothetical protein